MVKDPHEDTSQLRLSKNVSHIYINDNEKHDSSFLPSLSITTTGIGCRDKESHLLSTSSGRMAVRRNSKLRMQLMGSKHNLLDAILGSRGGVA